MDRYYRGDPAGCIEAADEAMSLGEELYNTYARSWRAMSLCLQGKLDEGLPRLEDLALHYENQGNSYWAANVLGYLGAMNALRGDHAEGRRLTERARAHAAQGGFDHLGLINDLQLAWIDLFEGRVDQVERKLLASGPELDALPGAIGEFLAGQPDILRGLVHLARGEVGEARKLACGSSSQWSYFSLIGLWSESLVRSVVARAAGEIAEAEGELADLLETIARSGAMLWASDALDFTAALRYDVGADADAVRLFGAADAGRARIGIVRVVGFPFDVASVLEQLRKRLGDEAFNEVWTEGAALLLDDAIAYALRGRGPRQRPPSGWDSVTPTEHKVIALVAEGLSNPQIAERLVISRRTVSTHLSHIFAKLGVSSRAELASVATKRAQEASARSAASPSTNCRGMLGL